MTETRTPPTDVFIQQYNIPFQYYINVKSALSTSQPPTSKGSIETLPSSTYLISSSTYPFNLEQHDTTPDRLIHSIVLSKRFILGSIYYPPGLPPGLCHTARFAAAPSCRHLLFF